MPTITGLRPLDVEFTVSGKKELISETDLNGVITYANEDFAELSGHPISKLEGSPPIILFVTWICRRQFLNYFGII